MDFHELFFSDLLQQNFSLTRPDLSEVSSITDYCFANIGYLQSINIPGNVRTIGEGAFYGCGIHSNSLSISLDEGVVFIKNRAFYGFGNVLKSGGISLNIPKSVKEITYQAFSNVPLVSLKFNADGKYFFRQTANPTEFYLTDSISQVDLTPVYELPRFFPFDYTGGAVSTGKNIKIIFGQNTKEIPNFFINSTTDTNNKMFGNIDASNMYQFVADGSSLRDTQWFAKQSGWATLKNGSILVGYNGNATKRMVIPNGTINMLKGSINANTSNLSSTDRISCIIPDSVVQMQDNSSSSVMIYANAIDVGKSVGIITGPILGNSIAVQYDSATLIFRQPKNMQINVGGSIATFKSSKPVNIYTDNDFIKNYDWSKDNVVPTFYPLSQAPAL